MSRRDETGAVAVLVAVMAVVLIGMTAFTADVGLAYANKRQIQTAADAAVLAAASELAEYPGNCSAVIAAGSIEAQKEATSKVTVNDMDSLPAALGGDYSASCVNGKPVVSTSVTAAAPRLFGNIFGSGDYALTRSASAVVEVGTSTKIRPYALCASDVPTGTLPSGVVEVTQPGQAHTGSDCSAAEAGGNWWYVACPEDANGSMSAGELAAALENGCSETISIVTPQDATTATKLSQSLTKNCSTKTHRSAFCLAGDTGDSSNANKTAYEKWPGLLGRTIVLPVFCTAAECDPDTVNGSGSNAVFPVYKLAAVTVCGFHIYDNVSMSSSSGGCSGNTFTEAYVDAIDKKEIRLFLRFVQVQTSGTQASNCALASKCDAGLRQVRLIE